MTSRTLLMTLLLLGSDVMNARRDDVSSRSQTTHERKSSRFHFRDCGSNIDRPIRVLDVSVRPSPIRTPGRVKVSALINVTSTLPTSLNADVIVTKSVLGFNLKIPCYRNVGSCEYKDVCGLLDSVFPTNRHCPRVLRRHHIPCRCPVNAGLLRLTHFSQRVPKFDGFMRTLAVGEYEILVRLYDGSYNPDDANREVGCVQLNFDIKQRRRRRRRARKHVPTPGE